MFALAVLAHHSEPADPELLRWLTHTVDAILGGPLLVYVVAGLIVVVLPAALVVLAVRSRRR